ncbi:hypothetical protein BON30_27055 [Cystobacter ferrugineus]|uniref:EGF-like domain-containing protein n=1 Tax=Cystobacter ferrugineus TaxID=83449 RepID=A0A1L9B6G7_9BACT|nr:hypothetical protein BON30_27055 [Cystobacter ferrugineus]
MGAAGCGPTNSENPPSGRCGDGVVQQQETCDDGLHEGGDGCDGACQVEQGWQCTGAPSRCTRQTGSCADGSTQCDANALCTETSGSAVCTCKPGYTGDGTTCTDVDECAIDTHTCDANATCANTPGSFTCACKSGYTGDGTTCTDIDECAIDTDTCDANATCANTPGSFTCACKSGYTGDGTTCTDIDECAIDTDTCDANATCTNTVGGFTCACKSGYTGDGTTCTDVDECTNNTDNCDANATCINTSGNFTCACKVGYSGNGVTCTDIDECASGTATCADDETCTNTPGHYVCTPNAPTCEAPKTICGTECVNTTSDANHCGGCGMACGGGQSCVDSQCRGGGSEFQISATWDRPGDGDLIVTTPTGNVISNDNMGPGDSTDQGQKDQDDYTGQGPENVFWASGVTPPPGTYYVCFETAEFFPSPSPDSPVTYSITVHKPGKEPQTFAGSFTSTAYTYPRACSPDKAGYVTSITYP